MTQQAYNLLMNLEDHGQPPHFLTKIHDRDTKFSHAFDTIFRSEASRSSAP
jgi:hypothetical protein